MRLSALQKYIIAQCYVSRRTRFPRATLLAFYNGQKPQPKHLDQQNSITKSLERLIDKGLLVGYGRRTPRKWFIDEIKLMPKGRAQAKRLQGEQQRLPFKISHH